MFRDNSWCNFSFFVAFPFSEMRCKIKKMFSYSYLKTWLNMFNAWKKFVFSPLKAELTFWHFACQSPCDWLVCVRGKGWRLLSKLDGGNWLSDREVAKCLHLKEMQKDVKCACRGQERGYGWRVRFLPTGCERTSDLLEACFRQVADLFPTCRNYFASKCFLHKRCILCENRTFLLYFYAGILFRFNF